MHTHSITSEVRFSEIKPGYEVADDGTVWSSVGVGYKPPRLGPRHQLKGHVLKSGHIVVNLGRGNKNARLVHRLVLEAFVGPCPEGMECRHIDGNPANNRLENLTWGTRQDNRLDDIINGTMPQKFSDEAIIRIRELAAEGMSPLEIALLFDTSDTYVRLIVSRRARRVLRSDLI